MLGFRKHPPLLQLILEFGAFLCEFVLEFICPGLEFFAKLLLQFRGDLPARFFFGFLKRPLGLSLDRRRGRIRFADRLLETSLEFLLYSISGFSNDAIQLRSQYRRERLEYTVQSLDFYIH